MFSLGVGFDGVGFDNDFPNATIKATTWKPSNVPNQLTI
jgi:hypothetical protein